MKLIALIFCYFVLSCFLVFGQDEDLEYEVCSYALKRKMLIEHCSKIRKRRQTYTYSELMNQKKRRYHHIDVVANDTSGGILIRNKRGKYEYCCLPAKKECERIFAC